MEVLEGTNLREGPAYGSFKSGVALTFAARILTFVGGVGSSIVVARWLGPEGLGTLAVLNVTVALALQIGCAGLPSANTYFIARDRRTLGPVWANTITFALAAGALLAVLAVALAALRPALFGGVSRNLLAIAALSIPFQLLTLLGLNVLLAMDRIGPMNLLDSMAPVLALLNAIVALVILRANLTTLVSLNTVAAIALSFSLLLAVSRLVARQKERRSCRPDFSLLKEMLVYGVKLYTSIMASVVIFRSDLLIVNHCGSVCGGFAGIVLAAAPARRHGEHVVPARGFATGSPRRVRRQGHAARIGCDVRDLHRGGGGFIRVAAGLWCTFRRLNASVADSSARDLSGRN